MVESVARGLATALVMLQDLGLVMVNLVPLTALWARYCHHSLATKIQSLVAKARTPGRTRRDAPRCIGAKASA